MGSIDLRRASKRNPPLSTSLLLVGKLSDWLTTKTHVSHHRAERESVKEAQAVLSLEGIDVLGLMICDNQTQYIPSRPTKNSCLFVKITQKSQTFI